MRGPLRGLAFGLVVSIIIFPEARHVLFTTAAAAVGAVVGAVAMVVVLSLASMRRR